MSPEVEAAIGELATALRAVREERALVEAAAEVLGKHNQAFEQAKGAVTRAQARLELALIGAAS